MSTHSGTKRLRRFMDGRVHAYEITCSQWARFHKGDRILVNDTERRVRGFAGDRDTLYVF